MHRVLFALFCIVFAVGINGAWLELPTTVDDNSIEMARLMSEFWSLKPAIIGKTEPFIYCQVIDQCCENEHRSQAASLFFPSFIDRSDENPFREVINACINSTALHNTNQWCSSYQEGIITRWVAQMNPDVIKYHSVFHKYMATGEKMFERVFSLCNNEQLHGFICGSNKKLVETCVAKILQGINDEDGDEDYREYLIKTKQALIDVNQELSQLFMKNTNTN